MKGYFHAAIGLAAFALLTGGPALAAAKAGSSIAKSSSRVTLKLSQSGEQRSFDSLAAAFHDLYEKYGSVGFYDTQVLDYATYGQREKLISAERAYFLVDADKASSADGEFKVVAFASRKAATSAQKHLGGELRDFEDTWEAVAEYWGVELNPQPRAPAAAPSRQLHRSPPPADCFT